MSSKKQYQNWFVLIVMIIVTASLWLYIGAKIEDDNVITVETIKTFNLLLHAALPMLAGCIFFFFYGDIGNDENRKIQESPTALAIVFAGVCVGTGVAIAGL